MRIIALDWETYWNSKTYTLSKMSPVAYIRDPRFTPLCVGVCAWSTQLPNPTPTLVFESYDIPEMLKTLKLDQPGTAVLGHNMSGFDALILSEYYGIHPWMVLDTICCARWCGISRMMSESHGVLTDYLKHGIKQAGTVVSDGKWGKEDFTPEEWTFFKQYCADDTQQCMENFLSMLPYLTSDALKFQSITAKMGTEPTLMLDQQMLEGYIRELDNRAEESMQEVSKLFHFATKEEFLKAIRSADKFCGMLRQLGCEPPMKYSDAKSESKRKMMEAQGMDTSDPDSYAVYTPALAKTDLEFLDLLDHPDPRVELLVQSRLDNNSSMEKSRALRLLETSKTGKPLPVMLKAFAAHTGRYGAGVSEGATDGNNLQNLSKRDPKKLTLRRAIQAPAGYKLIACDLSQIEARLLAYEACQDDLLDQFRQGQDCYSMLAENIFNVPWQDIRKGAKSGEPRMKMYRGVGKQLILSCLAGDTEVLTNTGWKPIVTVSLTDKLWDGEQWVTHQGLTCNGVRNMINVDGIRMTPDHLIWCGSSWNTAKECVQTPSFLNQALCIGDELLETLHSTMEESCSTFVNARTAVNFAGCLDTHCHMLWKAIANTVPIGIQISSSILTSVTQIMNRVLKLVNSLCLGLRNAWCLGRESNPELNALCLCNVPVARNRIGFYSATCIAERQHDVMYVLRRNPQQHTSRTIPAMLMSVLTPHTEGGCSIVSPPVDSDATIRSADNINHMAGEVSNVCSLQDANTLPISCHYRAGIIQNLTSIVSTIMGTMNRAISVLLHGSRILIIEGLSKLCSKKLNNCEPVYDILNAGPNHRFMIRSASGVLIVHNCGYGTSAQKLSDTLLRQGVHLHEDRERHAEEAKHCHSIYRLSNSAIVGFWKTCQGVLEHLAMGGSGVFGGPNGDLFSYGMLPVCGSDEPVPSITLAKSGYIMRYPNLRAEKNEKGRIEYFYDRQKGKSSMKVRIYGASLTENLTQSLAFQVLIWQACRMDEAGIKIVSNVHDAFLAIAPEGEEEQIKSKMLAIMTTTPSWLPNFPCDAEGEIGDTYAIA